MKLKSCLFCGEEENVNMVIVDDTRYGGFKGYIECGHCASRSSDYSGVDTKDELVETLVENWNQAGRPTIWHKIKLRCYVDPIYAVRLWWENLLEKFSKD